MGKSSSGGLGDVFPLDEKGLWWDRYLKYLSKHGVRSGQLVWYRRRVEQVLNWHPGVQSRGVILTITWLR